MVSCVVAACKNTSGKITKNKHGITFHRFPRDYERRCQWERAVNRGEQWRATPSSVVCSKHFAAKHFYLTESGLRRLSGEAEPSINISYFHPFLHFCHHYHHHQPCQEPESTVSQQPMVNIMPYDSEEVIQLKHKVRRLEAIAEHRKRRLNLLWQSKRRLRKKLGQMMCMVKHLIRSKKDKIVNLDS